MGLHSGKFGVVNGASTVRNWSITDSESLQAYVASNTLFGTGRRRGVQEWSGSYSFYGHTPPVMPGDLFSFLGYTAPNDDVSGTGMRYSGQAMCENVNVNWSWQDGAIINGDVNFQGHLGLTSEDGAEITDETVPVVPLIALGKIEYSKDDGSTWTEWTNLLSASLTLSCSVQAYVNSSTVVSSALTTGRKSGPFDWTLAVTEQDVRRDHLSKGESIVLRLWVDTSQYWELMWGKVGEFTGLTVDRESGAIMQQTVNISMDGFDPDESTYANSYGHVLKPDGTEWWPGSAAPTTA